MICRPTNNKVCRFLIYNNGFAGNQLIGQCYWRRCEREELYLIAMYLNKYQVICKRMQRERKCGKWVTFKQFNRWSDGIQREMRSVIAHIYNLSLPGLDLHCRTGTE